MITFKDFTNGFTSLCSQFFVFTSQSLVSYYVRDDVQFFLCKSELFFCIHYYLSRLSKLGLSDKVKSDYKFEDYEYFELAIYLNRLLRFYNKELGLSSVGLLHGSDRCRLSIVPSLPDLVVSCVLLSDPLTGKSYYMCYVDHFSYSSESVENLLSDIRSCDPYLFRTYNVILKVVGSHGTK